MHPEAEDIADVVVVSGTILEHNKRWMRNNDVA